MTKTLVDDFHAGQAVRHCQHEMRGIGEVMSPPAGTEFIKGRITPVTDGWLSRKCIVIDFLGRNQVERRIFKQDVGIRPFLIASYDGKMDVFLLHQLDQAVARIRRQGNFNITVFVYKSLQDSRHMGLRKRLARANAENAGNGIRFMRDIVLHILILLQFFFREGEEPVARICEMHTFIGTDDSGNKNYWAHVDSSAYSRQMQYYYDTFGFSKIGSVYGDEIVCAIPDYTSVAEENGFTIVGYKLEREAFADEDEYYNRLESIYRRMVREDGVDAYILNTDVIPSVEKAAELMKIFYDANIPVVAQVGSAYVKGGAAMMIVDPRDAVGTGPFVSNIIGSVFNGSVPEDLEQEYVSSPFLTLNLDVADEIGYKPSFEMLIACEKIICSE